MSREVWAAGTFPSPALGAPGEHPSTSPRSSWFVSPGRIAIVTTGGPGPPTPATEVPGGCFADAPAGGGAKALSSATHRPSAPSARLYPLVDVADRTFAKFTFFKID